MPLHIADDYKTIALCYKKEGGMFFYFLTTPFSTFTLQIIGQNLSYFISISKKNY